MRGDKGPKKENLGFCRQIKRDKLLQLRPYEKDYGLDEFIEDFIRYFDNEVDFNLSKIRTEIAAPGKLKQLIAKAKQKNTHPITEFLQELFRDLAS